MLRPGPALKVTVHLNNDTSTLSGFLHEEILSFLQQRGVGGATVFHPHAGYGAHRRLHVQGAGPVAGEHLPILILFVDEDEKIRTLLPDLLAIVTDGMIEAHPVEILKNASATEKVIR
jgi:uncharacterized protein